MNDPRKLEAKERLKAEIAEAVGEGLTLVRAAERFRCSLSFAHGACRAMGVKPRGCRRVSNVLTFLVLRELMQTGDSMEAIAVRHGLSHQRIAQIKTAAVDAGWEFLHR